MDSYIIQYGTYTRLEDGEERVYRKGDSIELTSEVAAALGGQVGHQNPGGVSSSDGSDKRIAELEALVTETLGEADDLRRQLAERDKRIAELEAAAASLSKK